ncbi:MAG: hypothetical protein QM756_26755 [Polyangiaceae bacterium]
MRRLSSSLTFLSALCVAALLGACSSNKRAPIPLDCSVLDDYELKPNTFFNDTKWFSASDQSRYPDGGRSVANWKSPYAIDPAVCGLTEGLQFVSYGNHDWGSALGKYGYEAQLPDTRDASAYDGLSFWAKSSFDRSFAITLADSESISIMTPADAGGCVPQTVDAGDPRAIDAGIKVEFPNPDFYASDNTGLPVANGCGNAWTAQLVTTDRWEFYTMPWQAFVQLTLDARVRYEGIDKENILSINIRAPKDSNVDTVFANFAWYRQKQ